MEHSLKLETMMNEGDIPKEHTGGENWEILHGDTLKLVKAFNPGIFDAVITDPPYASGGTKQNERNRHDQPEIQQHEKWECPAGL